jgi:hypothetical protein
MLAGIEARASHEKGGSAGDRQKNIAAAVSMKDK